MTTRPPTNFLELWVGRYRLALRTAGVVGVLGDWLPPAAGVHPASLVCRVLLGSRSVLFADLRVLMGSAPGSLVPYALTLATQAGWIGIGVDRVEHLPAARAPTLTRLPSFGLTHSQLFEGALRLGDRVLVVFDVEALGRYVALGEPVLGDGVFASGIAAR